MTDELMYTSAPRGLRPGASGFCTVAASAGLGNAWIERLETLSGYKPLYPAGDPNESANPVAFSHARISVAGRTRSVLSRVCFSGFDHTGRSNKFAHHLLLDDQERPAAGPAAVLRASAALADGWDGGEPRTLPPRRLPEIGPGGPRVATTWQAVTGDAGWAGHLASFAAGDPTTIVYIVYPLGTDVLALIDEAIALLPWQRRWQVTFNTYLTQAPSGVPCAWRCVMADTAAASMANGNVIDLAALDATALTPSPLCEAARTGRVPEANVRAAASELSKAAALGEPVRLEKKLDPASASLMPRVTASFAVASPELRRRVPNNVTVKNLPTRERSARRTPIWPYLLGAAVIAIVATVAVVIGVRSGSRGIARNAGSPTSAPAAAQALPTSDPTAMTQPAGLPEADLRARRTDGTFDGELTVAREASDHASNATADPSDSRGTPPSSNTKPSRAAGASLLDSGAVPTTVPIAVTQPSGPTLVSQIGGANSTELATRRESTTPPTLDDSRAATQPVATLIHQEASTTLPATSTAARTLVAKKAGPAQPFDPINEATVQLPDGDWKFGTVSLGNGHVWEMTPFTDPPKSVSLKHKSPPQPPRLLDLAQIEGFTLQLTIEGTTLKCVTPFREEIEKKRSLIEVVAAEHTKPTDPQLAMGFDQRHASIDSSRQALDALGSSDLAEIQIKLIDNAHRNGPPINLILRSH